MLILHHLNNSRSQRILWLLEELEVPYQIKFYQRNPKTLLAPPELKAIHPLGKSPVITDGDIVVAESGAIINYLAHKYGNGKLIPSMDSPDYLRYDYWLHYAEGSAMPPLVQKLIFDQIPKQKMPFFVRAIAKQIVGKVNKTYLQPQIKLQLDWMESQLKTSEWFAGNDFSAADIQMSFPIEAALKRNTATSKWLVLQDFIQRIHARPAYQRALQKGGEFKIN